ncbi:hypothetical protein GEMRC1_005223 [Eukaryota sp. GEM-RC1]
MPPVIQPDAYQKAREGTFPPLPEGTDSSYLDDALYSEKHIITGLGADDSLTDESFTDGGQPRSIIKELLKQVRPGADLSRITLPTFILEPRSLLEKLTDCHAHPYLLSNIRLLENPLERFLAVVRWYLSGFHTRPQGVKKPYNPILGEVFQAHWDVPNHYTFSPATVQYTAEQVSHHPPVSAFFLSSPSDGYSISGSIKFKSQFLGNAAAANMIGHADVVFDLPDGKRETYRVTFPKFVSRGIIMGTLFMELNGTCTVQSMDTPLSATIEFKKRGMFGGKSNIGLIDGVVLLNCPADDTGKEPKPIEIGKLNGNWMNEVTFGWNVGNPFEMYKSVVDFDRSDVAGYQALVKSIRKAIKKPVIYEPLFDVSMFRTIKKRVVPVTEQGQWESRRLWAGLTKNLVEDNIPAATEVKSSLEDQQRSRRNAAHDELNSKGLELIEENWHTPSLFQKVGAEEWCPLKEILVEERVEERSVDGDLEKVLGFNHCLEEWVEKWREARAMLN